MKSTIKNKTEETLNLSSNIIGYCNDENSFPHQLSLTNTQVSKLCKTFSNGLSVSIKFSKTQLSKVLQPGRFLGRLLGPLLTTGLP